MRKFVCVLLVCALAMLQFPLYAAGGAAESAAQEGQNAAQITLPIQLGGTIYDCVAGLGGWLTSSGGDALPSGGTVCFPLMFLGGDGAWYPVLAQELQGAPDQLLEIEQAIAAGGEMLSRGSWKTWDNGHYYIEYTATNAATVDAALDFSIHLKQKDILGEAQRFTGTVKAGAEVPSAITLPINLSGTVYACTVRLGTPLTSSGSETLPSGGTVCFPLEFLGGDGAWYPVRAGELQGEPGGQVETVRTEATGGEMLGAGEWKTWADPAGNRYCFEYTAINDSAEEKTLDFSVKLKQNEILGEAQRFAGTVEAGIEVPTILLPIQLGGTTYDCVADLRGYLTSSGGDGLPSGGTVCFPLMFLGGDGMWYPVLAQELQGVPDQLLEIEQAIAAGGEMLGRGSWKTWDDGHYYMEYTVTNASQQEKALDFSVTLQQGGVRGETQRFAGRAKAQAQPPITITAPVQIGETVYDCIIDLRGYLTSSGSEALPSGGTVCFPLMFLGGDGAWYPVLAQELQGAPDQFFTLSQKILGEGFALGTPQWRVWPNGHYFAECTVLGPAGTAVKFTASLEQNNAVGQAQLFEGMLAAPPADPAPVGIRAPIRIDGADYNCIVDLGNYLTSSGTDVLPSGGTVCFPLMFLGGDGVWYPVLKQELQGRPDELFHVAYTASLGDCTLRGGSWKTWDNGHYFIEYTLDGVQEAQQVMLEAVLHQGALSGEARRFSGRVAKAPEKPQIPLVPSASLRVERKAECEAFNTLSFTIADIRYNDPWPVDLASPNTRDAILRDGSVIKADLSFLVNGSWYPVRGNEVNESVEEMFTCEFNVLEGGECLGTPRFTTRLDPYGDIWGFEVPVRYAGENSAFRFTLCLRSADGTKVGTVYEVSGTVQDADGEFIVTTEPPAKQSGAPVHNAAENKVWPLFAAGGMAALTLAVGAVLLARQARRR